MENITLRPSKRLLTKIILILTIVSFFLILLAVILQLIIPLDEKTTSGEVAMILWPIVIFLILLGWLITLPISYLWIKNLSYVIKSERVTIYKGILTKIEQNIPYKAVTDFMLYRSLFDRILGIGSIKIQTAGQSHNPTGYEGVISGLIEYQSIMQELRTRLQRYNELHDPEEDGSTGSKKNLPEELLIELRKIRELLEKR